MNYATLSATISSYLQNYETDFLANIPTFVKQAEQRIYNTVQFAALSKTAALTATIGDQYIDAPTDFLAPYSFAVIDGTGAYSFLLNKDVSFMREAYPRVADTGLPKYYSIYGPLTAAPAELQFIVAPTPDAAYVAELQYFFYPESIVTASTTWLGDNFDTVLLYGCLVEAYTFLKGEAELVALYDGKYKEALALAKRMGDGMERQDTYRNNRIRQPVN
jgi:hypothetical protein